MFTLEQINKIDKSYFRIIGSNQFSITLQSKVTGHEWHILASDFRSASSCIVEHRHHHSDSFHFHGRYPSLLITIENILNHDTYMMLLFINLKHVTWSYEKEYRCTTASNAPGVPFIKAKPKEIYVPSDVRISFPVSLSIRVPLTVYSLPAVRFSQCTSS